MAEHEREHAVGHARGLLAHCGVAIHGLTDKQALRRADEIAVAAAAYAAATRSASSVGIADPGRAPGR